MQTNGTKEPGISDAERLEELRDRLRYANAELMHSANGLAEKQRLHEDLLRVRNRAQAAYMEWLEMMAAGVASK